MNLSPEQRPRFAVRRVAALRLRLRGAREPRRAHVYWPGGGTAPVALLVFLDTGQGGVDGADALCRGLCSEGGLVVLCASLSPVSPADATDATEWAADHAAELDAEPGRLLVAGEGHGGGLAAAVSLRARDHGWPAITRQVLIHPDLSGTAAGEPYTPHAPSPAGVAPALVVTGEHDPRRDHGRRYAARLRRAGVRVTELRHAAPSLTPHGQVLLDLAGALRHGLAAPSHPDEGTRP